MPTQLTLHPVAKNPGNPNSKDIHVGTRVELRRTLCGVNQKNLGESLGLTFQLDDAKNTNEGQIG